MKKIMIFEKVLKITDGHCNFGLKLEIMIFREVQLRRNFSAININPVYNVIFLLKYFKLCEYSCDIGLVDFSKGMFDGV